MKHRFLVIDDDMTVNKAAREVLKANFECDVDLVTDPEDGLHQFLKNKEEYSMILTDLNMPRLDGLQLCRLIRKEDRTIPIVIITAYASEQAYEEACQLGINEFVHKPFKPAAFAELIRKTLVSVERRMSRMHGFENQFWDQVDMILTGKMPAGYSSLDFIVRVLKKNLYEPGKVKVMERMVTLLKTEMSYLEARDNYMYLKTLRDQRIDRIVSLREQARSKKTDTGTAAS